MATKLMSIDGFHKLVREFVQDSIKEQMLNELKRLNLKELGGAVGTQDADTSQSTTGTSGATQETGAKSGIASQAGNNDPANSVMVPGTNMNINAGLQVAAKEQNFKRKAALINKISQQLSGMSGVVVKEEAEGDEPSQEWQIVHRALRASLREISNKYNELFDMFSEKGMSKDANKAIRALENVFDNILQDLQMKKDVLTTKKRAEKAMAKSNLIKRFMPTVLGGEFNPSMSEAVHHNKINTRDPMFPDLIRRISNLVYYGDAGDEEILFDLGTVVDEANVTTRWVKFIADMVRKGKEVQ